ncbi:alpha/beta fold hydrolase [Luteimonas sp. RC10]|uniref:esterase/lipase family protein n=1 Tax=Luteimonas sp. RC10 TaxID=2587035 RepID=UPI00160FFB8E|nr:alpha/beta fold hydrolase [Luteimonas sp. RC10]MBB3342523.1 pimeloyl-ACP methyl ester carboxylesterase [Luteimonas sp. RC10]
MTGRSSTWLGRTVTAALLVAALGGCAILREFGPSVAVTPMTPGETIALQRGDILTTGRLSAATAQTIRVAGLDTAACVQPSIDCIRALSGVEGIADERLQSALSELWLQHALTLASPVPGKPVDPASADARLQALLEAARHAYVYLFYTARSPGERAFEDRQTQVRDWYNHAVQAASTQLFDTRLRSAPATDRIEVAGWTLHMDVTGVRLPGGTDMPQELLPAASLSFKGLRSIYRRDGFGAELVAVMDDPVAAAASAAPDARAGHRPDVPAWSEMPSPSLTLLFRFPGEDAAEVLATREVLASAHDPYIEDTVVLRGQSVPLAANFSAGYGLWLARSGFAVQSLRTLLGRERGIERPHLYMMQPYDPQRRIVLMIHGLASSPEAWVNVANEIMGDEALRRNYQVWQVYYPTNMPIALNQAAIRRLVIDALAHVDPGGQAPASHDIVLVGHSMGGVIARLLVSSSGDALWNTFVQTREIEPARLARIRPRLEPMLRFEPLPQVGRAVFIAAPHRGTEVAGTRLGRWVSGLVRLPLTLLEGFGDVIQALAGHDEDRREARLPNSIDNLSKDDPFVRAAAQFPISPAVRLHSIIARRSAEGGLEDSDDGLVPYRSAHLPGALSEKIIVSGHSVQETAPAVLEIRRILHEDMAERTDTTPAEPAREAVADPGA